MPVPPLGGRFVGRMLRTKTIDLEQMYQGNPHPVGKIRITAKAYPRRARARSQAKKSTNISANDALNLSQPSSYKVKSRIQFI